MVEAKPMQDDCSAPTPIESAVIIVVFTIVAAVFVYAVLSSGTPPIEYSQQAFNTIHQVSP